MKSSVICSTYNTPHFLSLVLDSLLHQNTHEFELIIADDGSTSETKQLIDGFKAKAPFPVNHLWHEDLGWRKSQIHNLAISKVKFEHLIFIDGDCVLSPDFIQDHQKIAGQEKKNFVLMGRRVELSEQITKALSVDNYRKTLLSPLPLKLFLSGLTKESHGVFRRYSLNFAPLRRLLKADRVDDLLGCNFSLMRESMIQVNGFNDAVERGEDGDLFVRLRNTNHKLIGKKYYAVMFHLYHGRGNYQYVDDHYFELRKKQDYLRCEQGLASYL